MARPRVPAEHLDAWRALLNAHASVVGATEVALASAGLPPLSWYDVLWAVRRAPSRRLRMHELADSLTISRGGLTKLVDRLEREGLIVREADRVDRRGLYAVLTDAGEQTLRQMWPVYARAIRELFASNLSDDEARAIAVALTRVDRHARGRSHAAAVSQPATGAVREPARRAARASR